MRTKYALVGVLISATAPFMTGCVIGLDQLTVDSSDTGFGQQLDPDDCGDPPSTLFVDITITADSEFWSGHCGPETLALVYDRVEYKWLPEVDHSVLCDGATEIITVTNLEAKFKTSVYDWCTADYIKIDYEVDGFSISGNTAGKQLFDCPVENRTTNFWPNSAEGSELVYAGAVDYTYYDTVAPGGNCDNIVDMFTDPRR